MTTLKNFIVNFLSRGNVSDEWLEKFTTPANLKVYQKAVTHSSYDKRENYEVLEIFGDVVLNHAMLFWIRKSHPHITSIEWLTKIKHMLISTKLVSQMAYDFGITEVIRYSKSEFPDTSSDEYKKIVEDCVEALIGATVFIAEDLGLEHGVGHQVCQNIVFETMNKISPVISYKTMWDPVTILKEMYDKTKWPFGWIEQDIDKNNIRLEMRCWMKYHPSMPSVANTRVDNVQPIYPDMMKIWGNAPPGVVTKDVVERTNAYFYSNERGEQLGRFAYDKAQRLRSNMRKQFVTYFGPGEILVQGVCNKEKLSECKAELATRAREILKAQGLQYKTAPPMEYVFKEKKMMVNQE